jgi:hypothetical protein
MTAPFGVPQIVDYLTRMNLKIARVDHEREVVELAFHGEHGQWRMILGLQQNGATRKLLLIVPHAGTVTTKRRLECLEALMCVNYRIALGKFGLDMEDGEVRLEEAIGVGTQGVSYEQFYLVFHAIMQTMAMYHALLPRIVYGNLEVKEAIEACEQEFIKSLEPGKKTDIIATSQIAPESRNTENTELDLSDIMAEVTRIFEERKD